jgi:hypothetical protein
MKERSERLGQRTTAPTASHTAGPLRRIGLAVEGPGFLVWDEVASDARRRAAELSAVAPWPVRSSASRR